MDTFEEMRKDWAKSYSQQLKLDKENVESIIRRRRKTQINRVMQYFWASFVYQLIVYALLSHVVIRFWNHPEIAVTAIAGIAIFIPFTVMLITKFRKVAVPPFAPALKTHIEAQIKIVKGFFRFKSYYEYFLIPVSTLIGIQLCIKIFTDEGITAHPALSVTLFVITVLSCGYAIRRENDRNFARPLRELEELRTQCSS